MHLLQAQPHPLRISASDSRVFSRRGKATFSSTLRESNNAPPWNSTAKCFLNSRRLATPQAVLISTSSTRIDPLGLQQADDVL